MPIGKSYEVTVFEMTFPGQLFTPLIVLLEGIASWVRVQVAQNPTLNDPKIRRADSVILTILQFWTPYSKFAYPDTRSSYL